MCRERALVEKPSSKNYRTFPRKENFFPSSALISYSNSNSKVKTNQWATINQYLNNSCSMFIMKSLFYPTIPFYSQKPLFISSIKLKSTGIFRCSMTMGNDSRPVSGEVHVIIGPMFAGKSTALLRRIQFEVDKGRKVAMIKSAKDTRYAIDSVVTHDGAKMQCLPLNELSAFRSKLGADAYDKLDVIGIDEAQFFEDLYDFCCTAADRDGKTVIVAGLDGDYLRRRFGSVLDVVPLADTVTKLTARCELCGRPAHFTLRKTEQIVTELIGGADVYMPVCRQHYVNGQAVIGAARLVLESKKELLDCCTEIAAP